MVYKSQVLNIIKSILISLTIVITPYTTAIDIYSSQLINKSKHDHFNGFKLVKSKLWPNSECVIESGKQILYPGETTILKIKNMKECNESGIGYSIYKTKDKKNTYLLGYLSHRFANGKFSVQISRFCEGKQCIFTGLNPQQERGGQVFD